MGTRRYRTPEAARFVGLAPRTLEKMRSAGEGPAYFRIGTAVVYDESDLSDWLRRRRVEPRHRGEAISDVA